MLGTNKFELKDKNIPIVNEILPILSELVRKTRI